jgi:hypothetical protein
MPHPKRSRGLRVVTIARRKLRSPSPRPPALTQRAAPGARGQVQRLDLHCRRLRGRNHPARTVPAHFERGKNGRGAKTELVATAIRSRRWPARPGINRRLHTPWLRSGRPATPAKGRNAKYRASCCCLMTPAQEGTDDMDQGKKSCAGQAARRGGRREFFLRVLLCLRWALQCFRAGSVSPVSPLSLI